MKFNVVCISVAIGLLASCSQAAPIVNDVGKTVSDVVSANDGPVKAPLDDTTQYTEKMTTTVTGDVSGLTKRQGLDSVLGGTAGVSGVLGDLTGTIQNVGKREGSNAVGSTLQTASQLATGTLGSLGLSKRLLDNGGDASTMTNQGDVEGLVNGLLGKRQTLNNVAGLGGAVGSLTGTLGLGSTLEGLGTGPLLEKRGDVAGLTAPVTSTLNGLNIDQTVSGLDVSKLAGSLPLDTKSVTQLAGVKRGKKADKDDEQKADKDDDQKADKDDDKKTKDDKKAKTDNDDQPKQETDDQPKQEGDAQPKQEEGDAN